MLIKPQEYFNNPFHYTYENYFVISIDDIEYSDEIEEFIDDDIIDSYNKQYKTDFHNLSIPFIDMDFDRFLDYRDSLQPFSYFVIDWYFIYSKFNIQSDDEMDDMDDAYDINQIKVEIKTRKYIIEVLNFLNPNSEIFFDENEVEGKVVIIKLKNELRNIQNEIVNNDELNKHKLIFEDYENLKSYDS
jgi:hypothetical protein